MNGTQQHESGPAATLDDAAILTKIIRRDEAALLLLIKHYGSKILGLCNAILGDPSEAECVMSDVFFEIWNRPHVFDRRRGNLQTFLLTLARSRSIDRTRSRVARAKRMEKYMHREAGLPQQLIVETAEEVSVQAERKALVRQALETLPDVQQQALQLAFFAGLTHSEVAEELQLPLGTVKTHIRKGLLQLRPKLLGILEVGEAI